MLRGLAGLAGLVILLQVLPYTGLVSAAYLPSASETGRALWRMLAEDAFWTALGDTLTGWGLGLAIAVAAGVTAGALIGSVPLLRAVTASTIEFLRPIPSVALVPVAVLLYGTDLRSTLLLVQRFISSSGSADYARCSPSAVRWTLHAQSRASFGVPVH